MIVFSCLEVEVLFSWLWAKHYVFCWYKKTLLVFYGGPEIDWYRIGFPLLIAEEKERGQRPRGGCGKAAYSSKVLFRAGVKRKCGEIAEFL